MFDTKKNFFMSFLLWCGFPPKWNEANISFAQRQIKKESNFDDDFVAEVKTPPDSCEFVESVNGRHSGLII